MKDFRVEFCGGKYNYFLDGSKTSAIQQSAAFVVTAVCGKAVNYSCSKKQADVKIKSSNNHNN
jgi:hypothetical protein